MSAGYAERLKEYPNKGLCGLPENYDTSRSLASKISTLANLLNESSYTVVLTGAGISTSAGIPDFRGPNGIWTREQQRLKGTKKKRKRPAAAEGNEDDNISEQPQQNDMGKQQSSNNNEGSSPSFVTAKPTFTHRALAHLVTTHPKNNNKRTNNNTHLLQHLITQNIDGLHGKTTLPRSQLSILHGDIFTEKCPSCHTEYIRNYEISTIGLQPTGRYCTVGGEPPGSCKGALIDTLLDWEDALPEVDWEKSQVECAKAELILCLGTSLRIEPAGGLCKLGTSVGYFDAGADEWDLNDTGSDNDDGGDDDAKKKKAKKKKKGRKRQQSPPKKLGYVIVNLQETPYDDNATLVIRAKVDDVMEKLMSKLGYDSNWDGTDDNVGVEEHEQERVDNDEGE